MLACLEASAEEMSVSRSRGMRSRRSGTR